MYRLSPFTYIVSAVLSVGLAGTAVKCSSIELLNLAPPNAGETCESFLGAYVSSAGGQLMNPNATSSCEYCSLATTDQFLDAESIYFSERWRNIGILFAYCAFNIFAAVFLYWLARVPKGNRVKEVPNTRNDSVVQPESEKDLKGEK
jgi:ATP-binding cassette, subfamily G (WHITE), member 2, PDR